VQSGYSEEQAAVARRFGANVKRLREARGLSRDELASLSGIGADAIYRIETARRMAKTSTWFRLAGGLGAEPGELSEGIEWIPPEGRSPRPTWVAGGRLLKRTGRGRVVGQFEKQR
jgi:transcriptional regulator with XRE-family HTH domain